MIRFIATIFIMCLVGSRSSNACECELKHAQTQYCSSDFTILMTPHDAILTSDKKYVMYNIELEAIYRTANVTKDDEQILQNEIVYTPKYIEDCDMEFDLYEQYIVSGKIEGGKPIISPCDYAEKFDDVSAYHLVGFLGNYDDTCNCSICIPGHNCNGKEKVCKLELDDAWGCLGEYATCKDLENRCEWEGHEGINECYEVYETIQG